MIQSGLMLKQSRGFHRENEPENRAGPFVRKRNQCLRRVVRQTRSLHFRYDPEFTAIQARVGPGPRQCHLLANRWHGIPGVEHVRNLVTGEAINIIRPQPVAISHLHAIRPALWKLTEEIVQVGYEIPPTLVISSPESGKFEHK